MLTLLQLVNIGLVVVLLWALLTESGRHQLKKIAVMLWGKFESREEVQKFGLLAAIFFLLIGIYWALRPMKDSIFFTVVGGETWQPVAKWLSLVVMVPLIIFYAKLIDKYPRHKVFYVLTTFYAVAALLFAFFFMHPTIGLDNAVADPSRIIGWMWYIYVESFGSLIVALFWAFTTDITIPESAERGFPFIGLFGQFGNIMGPWLLNARRLGFSTSAPVVAICAFFIFALALLLWFFMRVTPKSQLVSYHAKHHEEKHTEPGFLEGLKLLVTKGYLLGIFLIISVYEIIVTVIDYHFKVTGHAVYPVEADYGAFLSSYATMTGVVSTLCVFFGINNIQRKLGMKASLVLLPILVAVAVVTLKLNPTALNIAFWIMVFSKAVNYALNQPTLKLLYIPTTKDTKYKAQAWIEMFGSRGSKAAGSAISASRGIFTAKYGAAAALSAFFTLFSVFSGVMIIGWLFVAIYVSKTYDKAIRNKEVVC